MIKGSPTAWTWTRQTVTSHMHLRLLSKKVAREPSTCVAVAFTITASGQIIKPMVVVVGAKTMTATVGSATMTSMNDVAGQGEGTLTMMRTTAVGGATTTSHLERWSHCRQCNKDNLDKENNFAMLERWAAVSG